MVRQTEWVLLKPTFIIIVAAYVPWFLIVKYGLLARFYRLLFFWSICLLVYGIYRYFLWLLNISIITNQRVAKIQYHSLFSKSVSEAPLPTIMNIGFYTKGLFPSLFGYGTVDIHLANISQPLSLEKVREPQKIKDLLWKLKAKTANN